MNKKKTLSVSFLAPYAFLEHQTLHILKLVAFFRPGSGFGNVRANTEEM